MRSPHHRNRSPGPRSPLIPASTSLWDIFPETAPLVPSESWRACHRATQRPRPNPPRSKRSRQRRHLSPALQPGHNRRIAFDYIVNAESGSRKKMRSVLPTSFRADVRSNLNVSVAADRTSVGRRGDHVEAGNKRFPVRTFHNEPAWRKTSMGPMAVEENIWSRRQNCDLSHGMLLGISKNHEWPKAYVQWHICHLVARSF